MNSNMEDKKMTKREACHKLADINERIFELEKSISDIESRLIWDDESRRDWYLERKAKRSAALERAKQEHDTFISEYADLLYS